MPESQSHRRAKRKAPGRVEVPIAGRRRVDSATSKTVTEVERNVSNLLKAVERLKLSRRPRKVLVVPQRLMKRAVAAMRRKSVRGTVKNLSGTRRVFVR